MLDMHLKSLELCYFEVSEAFKGLSNEHLWTRPSPNLLSVGELAGHIAYWEAVRFASDDSKGKSYRDLSNCSIKSPLLDEQFGYYTSTVDIPPTAAHLSITVDEVRSELLRIHEEAMDNLKTLNPSMDAQAPHWHADYNDLLRYVAFHIAYHTGQMYTVRHLLGETPPDN